MSCCSELPRGDESVWLIGVTSRRCPLWWSWRSLSRSSRRRRTTRSRATRRKKKFRTSSGSWTAWPTGQPAPNDLGLAWVHEDFLKATGNNRYIPFTVTYDPSKATGQTVSLYWRVVSKDAAAAAPAAVPAGKDEKKDDKKAAAPRFAYRGPEHHPRDGRPDWPGERSADPSPSPAGPTTSTSWSRKRPRSRRTPRRRRCR